MRDDDETWDRHQYRVEFVRSGTAIDLGRPPSADDLSHLWDWCQEAIQEIVAPRTIALKWSRHFDGDRMMGWRAEVVDDSLDRPADLIDWESEGLADGYFEIDHVTSWDRVDVARWHSGSHSGQLERLRVRGRRIRCEVQSGMGGSYGARIEIHQAAADRVESKALFQASDDFDLLICWCEGFLVDFGFIESALAWRKGLEIQDYTDAHEMYPCLRSFWYADCFQTGD